MGTISVLAQGHVGYCERGAVKDRLMQQYLNSQQHDSSRNGQLPADPNQADRMSTINEDHLNNTATAGTRNSYFDHQIHGELSSQEGEIKGGSANLGPYNVLQDSAEFDGQIIYKKNDTHRGIKV